MTDRGVMRALAWPAAIAMLVLSGCGATAAPTDIPIGGVREQITRQNLAAARDGMAGGLLEPNWLPNGFVLVNADYVESGGRIQSVDLAYRGGDNYLHVWQTRLSAADLGSQDPVPRGQPVDGTDWNANALPAAQVGRPGVVEFSTRLDDGRTVTVDGDLDAATMRHVLDSLHVQAQEEQASPD